jgi:hypothetical protein
VCARCIRLVHTVRLGELAQHFDLVERLRRYALGGTPQIVQASSPIDELRRDANAGYLLFRSPLHKMWERVPVEYGHLPRTWEVAIDAPFTAA